MSLDGRPAPAHLERFDLQADRAVGADDRAGLERLCRYLLRPPLAPQFSSQDDEVHCSFAAPAGAACPRGSLVVESPAICFVDVKVSGGGCASAASAHYELAVTLDGSPATLTLIHDDH